MKAIVVISFGSSVKSAREQLGKVEEYMGEVHKDRILYSSYTSAFIRKKLQASGEMILSPEEILEKLWREGYTDVLIKPTHIIPGIEYEKLVKVAEKYKDCFEKLTLDGPLIETGEDILRVCKTIAKLYPLEEDEALLFMGHGTQHVSNFIYPSIQVGFRTLGLDHIYMATVEGWPSLEDAICQIKQSDRKKIYLAPFLLIAGEHVMNDMIGEQEESWKNILEREGFSLRYIESGLSHWGKEFLILFEKQDE